MTHSTWENLFWKTDLTELDRTAPSRGNLPPYYLVPVTVASHAGRAYAHHLGPQVEEAGSALHWHGSTGQCHRCMTEFPTTPYSRDQKSPTPGSLSHRITLDTPGTKTAEVTAPNATGQGYTPEVPPGMVRSLNLSPQDPGRRNPK